jgi:PilZ domain
MKSERSPADVADRQLSRTGAIMGTTGATGVTATAAWSAGLTPGSTVDLQLYGDSVPCRVRTAGADEVTVAPRDRQVMRSLPLATAYGTLVVPLPGGAARVPVSARALGDALRLHPVGTPDVVQRREHVRHRIDAPVLLTWPSAAGTDQVLGKTVDVSRGGMRVAPAAVVWPDLGSRVTVAAELPGGTLHAEAEVLGKEPDYGLRLRFLTLPARGGRLVDELAD